MFYKTIEDLKKHRKFIDFKVVELQDYPLLSNMLSDISYQLTITINNLKRAEKVVQVVENEDNGEIYTNKNIRKK